MITPLPRFRSRAPQIVLAAVMLAALPSLAAANTPQDRMIAHYAAKAKAAGEAAAFSADRGRKLFLASPATGKPDTPSCTSCHTDSPFKTGQTRAGKAIAPMALSKTPDRYADLKKVEKWFRRNCKSVLGRTCTPGEKGDFLTFMTGQ